MPIGRSQTKKTLARSFAYNNLQSSVPVDTRVSLVILLLVIALTEMTSGGLAPPEN